MKSLRAAAATAACGVLVSLTGAGAALAQPAPATPSGVTPATPSGVTPATPPAFTPETDPCPFRVAPAPAGDATDLPRPGQPAVAPLPVSEHPVGGDALGNCGLVLPEGAPPLPAEITSAAWVVSDVDTGEVLAAQDAHGRYRPASTIKVLLALVALEELDLNKTVVALQEDEDMEGSRVGVGPHGTYSIHTVLQGLMMASGNDTANMLARELGGVDVTLEKMNAKARSLGALDTRAATPSGLDGPGMSSSPYDLSAIFREAMKNPTFRELVSVPEVFFPGYPKDPADPLDYDRPGFVLKNDNTMLYQYPGALGGKTGFTNASRHTYIGAAQRDGRTLQVTLMGGEVQPLRPWAQAVRLLDYGFALPAGTSVGTLDVPAPVEPVTELAAVPDTVADAAPGTSSDITPDAASAGPVTAAGAGTSSGSTSEPFLIGGGVGAAAAATLLGAWSLRRDRVRP
ncbi:penicillin-binding protein [Rhodococcus triatomae]|uniref:D-alanyl-D-alanine carboxypeptidase (Penicillin-binding protein 5/6) n=1 Tax=Rhodococcus triatomae TaxID=300028 RepID=A0A1G8FJB8_9NOCA|nr:serine hydrolase [Rhodococcus triatomae]QNG19501.1 penicillin-binding protein [Rhodococcus triatomae]QNG24584.1 penicillin-binding protein [Rhodococcus triatomae]SDH82253.1 D-alanyl-D-alanine carboxypeptidase (penicillin-binding protein 5/6) [Rhodococcus triatomae]